MPWYSMSQSGLIVRGTEPARSRQHLMLMLANTLEQAAKQEDDPDEAAHEAGSVLHEKGILSAPPGSLTELLDLARMDDQLADWLGAAAELPLRETEAPEPDPSLWDLAEMA
jgi:hypothetical protein